MGFLRSSMRPLRVGLILSIAISTAVAIGTKVRSPHKKTVAPSAPVSLPHSEPVRPTAADKKDPEALALPILLRAGGFVPNEITRPAGDYFFAVGNQSGVREVTFRLAPENAAKLREVDAKRDKPWKQLMHLTPGTYLLTEADHPAWVCRITILSK